VSCAATPFSEQRPPDPHTASFSSWWYEGDGIWAGLAPPYEGRWFAGEPALKVLWYSDVAGELRISGTRLDGSSGALSVDIPSGYEQVAYQPSAILVPEPGCWEVSGSVGHSTLRVVAEVLGPELHPLRAACQAE
jgi:hypothetical protein